jgi:molybdopterin synthase sulfur carrier subunit
MARVHLSGELRRLADGGKIVEMDAHTVIQLIDGLEERFPALRGHLRDGVAVAVDGEVMVSADYVAIRPETEIHFLPAITGG